MVVLLRRRRKPYITLSFLLYATHTLKAPAAQRKGGGGVEGRKGREGRGAEGVFPVIHDIWT